MKHPLLYHKAKGGDLRQWQVWTEGSAIVTEYGSVDGKLQTSRKEASAKNVGRSNETSPEEQAGLEAAAMHRHKLERKYAETPEGAQETLQIPMLAHGYKGAKQKKATYPAHVQPKLDGVRCIAQRGSSGEIILTSRQAKLWDIPHIQIELNSWLPEGMVLDGELYVHGESCQKITSWARSADPNGKSYKPESQALVYHVYDMPVFEGEDGLDWEDRCGRMQGFLQGSDHVIRVEHTLIISEDELWTAHGSYIGDGYEGVMYRGLAGKYLWGYRSSELLKVKKFRDDEFRVIGARDGKGKMEGCVIWNCQNNLTSGTFECTMKVPMAERRRMFERREDYIGRLLTVRFFDLTDDNIPRFPVGIVFRDPIDLP